MLEMPVADPAIVARRAEIVKALEAALPGGVISDPAETRAYECDALTAYACAPLAVALPRSTEEVARLMRLTAALGVSVVARGAGTSLAGGALPSSDAVLLSLTRMTALLEVDLNGRQVHVQAGRTNLSVSAELEEDGFFYAPDPSSQLACAIGGNIGMNAGGAHCLKYGVTTNNLLGLTLVTHDGEIIEIGEGSLDLPGFDWLALICGSEGQLGIVTEARLKILPRPEGARPVLIGFSDPVVAGQCVSDIIRAGVLPVAMEFMDRPAIRATEAFAKPGYPDCEALLIVEVEGAPSEIDAQLADIIRIARALDPVEIRESASAAESALIWKGRKSAFGAMGKLGDYICLDGTVPVSALPEVLRRSAELAREAGLGLANVFHAGDGNMHPLILYNANAPGELERAEALGAGLLELCVSHGGVLTGEHGVGIEKRELMGHQFTPDALELMMSVKDVFDPSWRLNPAKVFPLALSAARRGRLGRAAA